MALALLLVSLVLVFAVVHDTTNGGILVWSNLDQIQISISSTSERVVGSNDPQLLAVLRHDADLRDADLIINPGLKLRDGWHPFMLRHKNGLSNL